MKNMTGRQNRIAPTQATIQRMRGRSGMLIAAALQRLDNELPWYRTLPADERSWVGLIAQSGINAFFSWYANPNVSPKGVSEIFSPAPTDLTRSISLQHTLQLVRIVVEVVEAHSEQLATPGTERDLREAVLRYSREVAFSAAEVYARAAELRGAWDARVEALIVDSIIRADIDPSLASRVSALGWVGMGNVFSIVGTLSTKNPETKVAQLRKAARKIINDTLVGTQGHKVILLLGGQGDPIKIAGLLLPHFAPGPVVIGSCTDSLLNATNSVIGAINGHDAARGWVSCPRPVLADELLPERVLLGDKTAIETLVRKTYRPLAENNNANLETLVTFLNTGRSLEAAARELYVHPNTVRYRLKKIAELSGWDPLEPRDSFILQIALSLGKLHGPQSEAL